MKITKELVEQIKEWHEKEKKSFREIAKTLHYKQHYHPKLIYDTAKLYEEEEKRLRMELDRTNRIVSEKEQLLQELNNKLMEKEQLIVKLNQNNQKAKYELERLKRQRDMAIAIAVILAIALLIAIAML